MSSNPLNSLLSPEQMRILDREMFFANFIPFKKLKLRRIENEVTRILKNFHITFPVILDLNYPKEGSKYGIALIDSYTFDNYKIIIHYNPRLVTHDFNQLVLTGLHEYAHLIFRQKEFLSLDYYASLFPTIDHVKFIKSIDHLTNQLLQNNILQIPPERRTLLGEKSVVEDCFAEGFAWFFWNSRDEIIVQEKQTFEAILEIHIKFMKEIRRINFGEF